MKRALIITAALLFPLLVFGTAEAQEAKKAPPKKAPAKAAAPAPAADAKKAPPKKAPPKKAMPAAKAGDAKAATPADKKDPADAKAAAKEKAKAKAKGKEEKPAPEMCDHCKGTMAHLKVMAAEHKAIAESFKGDTIAKQLKGKAKKSYKAHTKATQKFHKDMARLFEKNVKAMERLHKGKNPDLCHHMGEMPDEAKAAMMARGKANMGHMKKMATELNAMVANAEAQHAK